MISQSQMRLSVVLLCRSYSRLGGCKFCYVGGGLKIRVKIWNLGDAHCQFEMTGHPGMHTYGYV